MVQSVHFIPVGLGRKHYTRPLVGGNFSISKIVLLAPADVEVPGVSVEATREFLTEVVDIEPEVRRVPTEGFDRILAAGYREILEEIEAGNEVFINAASSPWGLGAGYARAAEFVLADRERRAAETDASKVRGRLTLYYTEPEGYHIDELTAVAAQASDLQERVQQAKAVAGDLREDVDTDVRTIEALLWVLEQENKSPVTIEGVLAGTARNFPNERVKEISGGLRDIVQGIELVTQGINVLSKEENLAVFEKLPSLLDKRLRDLAEGIQQVAGRTEQYNSGEHSPESEYSPVDLFRYFVSRLEQVQGVLESVENIESDQFGNDFTHSASDIDDLLTRIEATGVTHGARKFDGSNYYELPKPLDLDLSELQRALVYTLAVDGDADSLQLLTLRLTHHALVNAAESGSEIPSHPQVDAIHTGEEDTENRFLREILIPRMQGKIQYNVTNLVNAGLVEKSNIGREKRVSLSHSGDLYVAARGMTDDSQDAAKQRTAAFEKLSSDVVGHAKDFVQSHESSDTS